MPINPNIPLQTNTIDPSQGINSLASAFQFKAQQKESAANKELRDMQIAQAKFAQLDAIPKYRTRNAAINAAQLHGFLEAGDTEGAKNFLQTSRSQIVQSNELVPGLLDTNGLDQALGMLEAGDIEGLKKTTASAIKSGQMLGILQQPEKGSSYAPVYNSKGEIVAQENTSTGEVKEDPRAPKSPSSVVNVKVDQKTGESFAKEIGPMMTESRSNAQGALQAIDTVKRIRGAIEGGNVSLGPTATLRQNINQFAQVLGAAGETTEEKLVNTRNAMRGLSQLALAARKQLKGQGQVSDFEGKLIQRAEAGEINDFTLPELKDFISVTERMSEKVVKEHKRNLGVMKSNPDLERFVPFYDIGEDAPAAAPELTATNPQTGEKLILRNGKWQTAR